MKRKGRSTESNLSAIRPLEAKYAHIGYINACVCVCVCMCVSVSDFRALGSTVSISSSLTRHLSTIPTNFITRYVFYVSRVILYIRVHFPFSRFLRVPFNADTFTERSRDSGGISR